MRPGRVALAVLLVVLAVVAALLAADVRAWPAALHSGDARYAASPAAARWHPSTVLPSGLTGGLLGTGDDVAARRAIRLFRLAHGAHGSLDQELQTQGLRAQAELALSDLARSSDPRVAAQASDLLGVLAFGDLASGGGANPDQADRAVSAFVNAVRLYPADEAAKVNLELVLRLFRASGIRLGATAGAGTHGQGRHGAGTGIPGGGY
ncbi:MAG: hypothetical protein ACXVZ2_05205 [Gaiellaceae bacterium]